MGKYYLIFIDYASKSSDMFSLRVSSVQVVFFTAQA